MSTVAALVEALVSASATLPPSTSTSASTSTLALVQSLVTRLSDALALLPSPLNKDALVTAHSQALALVTSRCLAQVSLASSSSSSPTFPLSSCSPRSLLSFAREESVRNPSLRAPVALVASLASLLARLSSLEFLLSLEPRAQALGCAVVAALSAPSLLLPSLLLTSYSSSSSSSKSTPSNAALVMSAVALHTPQVVSRLMSSAGRAVRSPTESAALFSFARHSALLTSLALNALTSHSTSTSEPWSWPLLAMSEPQWLRALALTYPNTPTHVDLSSSPLRSARLWRLQSLSPTLSTSPSEPLSSAVRTSLSVLDEVSSLSHGHGGGSKTSELRSAVQALSASWTRLHLPRDEHARPSAHSALHNALVAQILHALTRSLVALTHKALTKSDPKSDPKSSDLRLTRECRAHVFALLRLVASTSRTLESAVVSALVDSVRSAPSLRVPWSLVLGSSETARSALTDTLLGELVPAFPAPALESYAEVLPRKPSWPRDLAVEALFTQHVSLWPLLTWLSESPTWTERSSDLLVTLLASLIGSWHAAEASSGQELTTLVSRTRCLVRILQRTHVISPRMHVLEALVALLPSAAVTSLLHELVWPALQRARSLAALPAPQLQLQPLAHSAPALSAPAPLSGAFSGAFSVASSGAGSTDATTEAALRRLRAIALRHVDLPGVAALLALTLRQ